MDNQSEHISQSVKAPQSNQIPWWVKSICLLGSVGAISFKFLIGEFDIDFNAFLSLILALFSIFLSAEFYFKATDTSNRFYDNVYKFTKDITELLARIEASFGQQLKTLDDRQCLMNERLYGGKLSEQEISNAKNEIEKREAEKERIIEEYKAEINKLTEDREISEKEKNEIKEALIRRNREYDTAREDIEMLKEKLQKSENVSGECGRSDVSPRRRNEISRFTLMMVRRHFMDCKEAYQIAEVFRKIKLSLPDKYLQDLGSLGFYSGGSLTQQGIIYFQRFINREREFGMVANTAD